MLIAPKKLGGGNTAVPARVLPFLADTIEFQLESLTKGADNWRGMVERHSLSTVILHIPCLSKCITAYVHRIRESFGTQSWRWAKSKEKKETGVN